MAESRERKLQKAERLLAGDNGPEKHKGLLAIIREHIGYCGQGPGALTVPEVRATIENAVQQQGYFTIYSVSFWTNVKRTSLRLRYLAPQKPSEAWSVSASITADGRKRVRRFWDKRTAGPKPAELK